MRLDKYLSETGIARSDAVRAVRGGLVTVNGAVVKNPSVHIEPEAAAVTMAGKAVQWRKYTYVMLNKPSGYVSSTESGGRTVMTLLPPEFSKMNMFPAGRLDMDTLGLLLITNDGPLAHRLLSPAHHVPKTYRYSCNPPIDASQISSLESGVDIGDVVTKPCRVEPDDASVGKITVTEGKYHQIKRMFEAVGSEITYLERITFGPLTLDEKLERGEWRYLSKEETAAIGGWIKE
jgi:16S rRNA pseudouridine516 synthase